MFYELNSYKSKIVCYRAAVIERAPMHLHCLHVNAYVMTQFRSRLDFGPARAAYNNDASVDRCIRLLFNVVSATEAIIQLWTFKSVYMM